MTEIKIRFAQSGTKVLDAENKKDMEFAKINKDKKFYCKNTDIEVIPVCGDINKHHWRCINELNEKQKDEVLYYSSSNMTDWHVSWENKIIEQGRNIKKEFQLGKLRCDAIDEDYKIIYEFEHSKTSSASSQILKNKIQYYKDNYPEYKIKYIFDLTKSSNIKEIERYKYGEKLSVLKGIDIDEYYYDFGDKIIYIKTSDNDTYSFIDTSFDNIIKRDYDCNMIKEKAFKMMSNNNFYNLSDSMIKNLTNKVNEKYQEFHLLENQITDKKIEVDKIDNLLNIKKEKIENILNNKEENIKEAEKIEERINNGKIEIDKIIKDYKNKKEIIDKYDKIVNNINDKNSQLIELNKEIEKTKIELDDYCEKIRKETINNNNKLDKINDEIKYKQDILNNINSKIDNISDIGKNVIELQKKYDILSRYENIEKFMCMKINKTINCFLEQGNNRIPIFEIEIPDELKNNII